MTNADRIERMGRAIYGPLWIRRTASALGVNEKQVRRWLHEGYDAPKELVRTMRHISERHIEGVQDAVASCFSDED